MMDGGRIHPWECPDCGDDGAATLDESMAVYRCPECGCCVPIDEVGPSDTGGNR